MITISGFRAEEMRSEMRQKRLHGKGLYRVVLFLLVLSVVTGIITVCGRKDRSVQAADG